MMDTTYYTPEELAEKFSLSLSTIYNLIKKGEIPNVKIGKCYRIPHSALLKYLNTHTQTEPAVNIPASVKKFAELAELSTVKGSIIDIMLFGSYARGDFDEDSDIDILVVLKKKDSVSGEAIAAMSDEAMASTGYDEFLSVVQLSKEQWEEVTRLKTSFYRSISNEGISLWKK